MITFLKLKPGVHARFVCASPEKKLPTVLIVHGWKSANPFGETNNNVKIQEVLQELGYNSLLVALSGHLPSEGKIDAVTRKEHLDEIATAYKWMSGAKEVDAARISACGTSYGAYLLSAFAASVPFKAMALRAAALYPDDGWDNPTLEIVQSPTLLEWRKSVHGPDESKALAGISIVDGPVALFSSEHDELMPPAVPESYLRAAKNATQFIIKGAKHTLDRQQTHEFLQTLKTWFQNK